MKNKKPFWLSAKMLFLIPIFFMAVYAIIFYLNKESATNEFTTLIKEVPSINKYAANAISKVQNYFPKYGALTGVAGGIILMIVSSLLYLIMKIIRLSRWKLAVPIVLLIGLSPLVLFGGDMVYFSMRYTALSGGIILYLGYPLWYASLVTGGLLVLLLIKGIFKKIPKTKVLFIPLILGAMMTLSGCNWLNIIIGLSCEFSSDKTHCVQEQAVGTGESENCDKVPPKNPGSGSNPPKDKCYMMVAENTGDPTACSSIEGGFASYTKEECLNNVFSSGNPEMCIDVENEQECRNMYANGTGNCGNEYSYNDETGTCETAANDPECTDPTFTSQCASSHSVLICNEGKKRTESCQYGCFEAACRNSEGVTDIEEEEVIPEEEVETDTQSSDEEQENDSSEDKDEKEEEKECDCKNDETCINGKCVFEGCRSDDDCEADEKCTDTKCVNKEPQCNEKDNYCVSSLVLQYCNEGVVATKDCQYGCGENKCLTEKEKEKEEEKKIEEETCKEGYSKCLTDITIEICSNNNKITQKCEFGCDKKACRTEKEKKCTGIQRLNPFCEEDDSDIEDKVESDISTIKDAATGKYMEMLQESIKSEKDPSKLKGLQAYQKFLEQAGETMETAETTIQTLKDIKRIFLDSYDPSMDIGNMPVDKILKPGIFDRMSTAIFGGPETPAGIEMAEADGSLTVYEAMLSRQSEIDFLKQSRMNRLGNVVSQGAKDKMTGKLADKAQDIAGNIAGHAMIAVTVVDYALTSFQDEAKKQLFIGLSRAYNRRRLDLQESNPDMTEEDIHKKATEEVKESPYRDAKGLTFIKYGNILENADCQKGTGNQLCIDNRVFWTAMDKAYQHTHRREIHDRWMDKLNREFEEAGY